MEVCMKKKINRFWRKADYCLRWLCKRPSPMKRLITVLFVCVAMAGLNVWFVYSSIYNLGKNDAKKEMLEMHRIEKFPIIYNDSIHLIKIQEYDE
jgi:hypothetical protein